MGRKNRNPINVNELTVEQKSSMKSRIIVGIILAVIGIPTLFVGGWLWFVVLAALTVLATCEILSSPRKALPYTVCITVFVLMIVMTFWVFVKNNVDAFNLAPDKDQFFADLKNSPLFTRLLYTGYQSIYISPSFVIVMLCVLFLMSFLVENFTVFDVFYFFTMTTLVGIGFSAMSFLRFYPSYVYSSVQGVDVNAPMFAYLQGAFLFTFIAIGVFFNDIGAYFTGVLFGKNKVNPRISPKKTWEGIFGGGFISVIFSTGFAIAMSLVGMPLLPILSHEKWYFIIILSVLLVLLSNLGDFSFSAIKRHFEIKDYSNIFKDHGGVLDRFDSFIFASIGAAAYLVFINEASKLFGL